MYLDKKVCAVTHHLVDEVSRANPEHLRTPLGEIKLYETLHHLGFHINWKMYNKDVSIHQNMRIRSCLDKKKCYKTLVYKGKLRNEFKEIVDGEMIYDKYKTHHLSDQYDLHEVLQPVKLMDYVKESEFFFIEDFGGKSTLVECLEGA